ncbi:peptidylprolyl isomerase [Patescibacteria group bacterium]
MPPKKSRSKAKKTTKKSKGKTRKKSTQKRIEKLFKTKDPGRIKVPQKKSVKVGKKRVGLKMLTWIIILVLVAIILFLAILGVGIYRYDWDNQTTNWVSRVIPYPASLVNYHLVSLHDYRKELDSTKHYQGKLQGIDFNAEEGKVQLERLEKDILEQMINNEIVEQKAKDFDLSISKVEINDEYSKIVKANGGEEKVEEILDDYYKWSVKEFKDKIKTYLLTQKLQDKVASDDVINQKQKEKAESILAQLKKGVDFEKLAKKYSEDQTNAANGGYIGLISKGQKNDSALDEAVFSLKKGKLSGVTKIKTGYAIFKLDDIKGKKRAVRYILIKYKDFTEWMDEQKNEAKIYRYIAQ